MANHRHRHGPGDRRRNIDLSVGSVVGIIAMSYALLMTDWLPENLPFRWIIALGCGVGIGATIGAVQGFIIAYVGVPSFIVTLGGLLSIRGAVWVLSQGAAVSGLDPNFRAARRQRTGVDRRHDDLGRVDHRLRGHRRPARLQPAQRRRFGYPLRPLWAEIMLATVGCLVLLGLAAFVNGNYWPPGAATRYAQANGITEPPGGLKISVGFPGRS